MKATELRTELDGVTASEPAENDNAANSPMSGIPTITVDQTEIGRVVNEAEAALARLGIVYVRNRTLVRVARDKGSSDWLRRPDGMPVISELAEETTREFLGIAANWTQNKKTDEGIREMRVAVPAWVVATLHKRGSWDLPSIEGITESPVLRADGTILDTPGYDASTRLIYEPGTTVYPTISSSPTQSECRDAMATLLDPFCDFCFVAESDRAAFAALVLTLAARPAIDGPVPMYSCEAPTPGSGKTRLLEAASLIVTGRKLPRMSPTDNEEETRKRITTLVLECPAIVLLDNVAGGLSSPSLESALTGDEWSDRLLGGNKKVHASIRFVWTCSGNNLEFRGDLGRRVVPIYLDPKIENPEDRTDFRYPDLLRHITDNRPALLAAALTVLRGYFAAGLPKHGNPAKGSFEAWDGIVRGAVVWTLGVDPLAGVQKIREAGDVTKDSIRRVMGAWQTAFRERPEIVSTALNISQIRDAFGEYLGTTKEVTPQAVGLALRKLNGRIVDGMRIVESGKNREKVRQWAVQVVGAPDLELDRR